MTYLIWTINSPVCNNFVQPPQSLSKFHRSGNFSNSLRSSHTLEREKPPWKHWVFCYSHIWQVTSKQWDVCRYPGRIMGLPSPSQLHTGDRGGGQRSAEVSLCATSSFLWAKRGTVCTGKWTYGFIKQKTACRTGWLLSQHSRKELPFSITGHHTGTSEGRWRIRHMLCGQSKAGYSENQEQNSPHLCSAQCPNQTLWIQRQHRAITRWH